MSNPEGDPQLRIIGDVIETMGGPAFASTGAQSVSIHELPTAELVRLAEQEAQEFQLPANWKDGRKVRNALIIDAPYDPEGDYLPDCDDGIDQTIHPDGSRTLHVGIADVGTFLADKPSILALAARRGWTRYSGNRVAMPMIPAAISQNKLSLLDGQERPSLTIHIPVSKEGVRGPVTFTREVLACQAMSYPMVGRILAARRGDDYDRLKELEYTARLLYAARHQGARIEDAVLEDEQGWAMELDPGQAIAQLIVQEAMIAAGAGSSEYVDTHNIPALHRVHAPLQPGGRPAARYNSYPEPHEGLYLPDGYMHVSSPLRRFPDVAAHCNIVADLEDQPYPFPKRTLEYEGGRLNRMEQDMRAFVRDRGGREYEAVESQLGGRALHLVGKMADGTASEGDLARALFAELTGEPEEIAAVRQQAAQYIAERIHLARAVISIGVSRNHLKLTPTDRRNTFTLEDLDGRFFRYRTHRDPAEMAYETARLLGHMAGVVVEPQLPEHLTPEGRILANANPYLEELQAQRRLKYFFTVERDQGNVTVTATVIMGDTRGSATATTQGFKSAVNQAAAQLIRDHDLIHNPPDENAQEVYDMNQNPVVQLNALLVSAGSEQPQYSYEKVSLPPDPVNKCIAVLEHKGKIYRVETEAPNNKTAKQDAARQILEQIAAHEAGSSNP